MLSGVNLKSHSQTSRAKKYPKTKNALEYFLSGYKINSDLWCSDLRNDPNDIRQC